eukprot:16451766-Heterocapsa_arctica.AAC.1
MHAAQGLAKGQQGPANGQQGLTKGQPERSIGPSSWRRPDWCLPQCRGSTRAIWGISESCWRRL